MDTRNKTRFPQRLIPLLIGGALSLNIAVLASDIDPDGYAYTHNPELTEVQCASSSSSGWGRFEIRPESDPQIYRLHADQEVAHGSSGDATGSPIYLPPWCGSRDPRAGYELSKKNVDGTYEAVNPVDEISGLSLSDEMTDSRDYSFLIDGNPSEAAIDGDFSYRLSYDPGGGSIKKHWHFKIEIVEKPLVSPKLMSVGSFSSKTVWAEIGLEYLDATDFDGAKEYEIVVRVNNRAGISLGSMSTPLMLDGAQADTSSTSFVLTVNLDSPAPRSEPISSLVTATLREIGTMPSRTPGTSRAMEFDIPASPSTGNISVGVPMRWYVYEDAPPTPADDAAGFMFNHDINSDINLRDCNGNAMCSFANWQVQSSNRNVAEIIENTLDDDANLDDDWLNIEGVYQGESAVATAFVTVIGEENECQQTAVSRCFRIKEVIRVSVLKNQAPVFALQAATISWSETAAEQTVDLTARFVNPELASDSDEEQQLTFALLDANDVVAATETRCGETGSYYDSFYLTSDGMLAVEKTGENCDDVAIDFESKDTHILTVQVSDGHGGTDVMQLTINIKDGNDRPRIRSEAFLENLVLLEGAEETLTQTIDVSKAFRDDDGDQLCYEHTTPTLSDETMSSAVLYLDVSQSGSSICASSQFSLKLITPSVDSNTPPLGFTGVVTATFEITAVESTASQQRSEPVEATVKLVYGRNVAPHIWGGRRASAPTDSPYLSSWTINEESTFEVIFTAQDVQPRGEQLCFELPEGGLLAFGSRHGARPITKQCEEVQADDRNTVQVTVVEYWKDGENPLDYESTRGQIASTLTVTDLSGATHSLPFTVNLVDRPEPPVELEPLPPMFALVGDDSIRIDLNDYFDDGDGEELSYTATSDAEESSQVISVAIDGSRLEITFTSDDIPNTTTVRVDVSATDQTGQSAYGNFIVTVKNENNPPEFLNSLTSIALSVAEDSRSRTSVGRPTRASDPDAGDVISYSLQGDSRHFTVDNRGQIRTQGAMLDHERHPQHLMQMVVADLYGGVAYLDVTIDVTDANEAPEFANEIPEQHVLVAATTSPCVDANDYFKDVDQSDQDAGLLFEATSRRTQIVTTEITGASMVCATGASPGRTHITVTATDRRGESVKGRFRVTVANNNPPQLVNPIADRSIQVGSSSETIDLNAVFDDGDLDYREPMTFEASIENIEIVTSVVNDDGRLVLTARETGETTVTVTATDQNAGVVSDSFLVTATRNEPPQLVRAIPDIETRVGRAPSEVSVADVFSDPGDTLRFDVTTSDADIATAAILADEDDPILRVYPHAIGTATGTVIATDSDGNRAEAMFNIRVDERNDPPMVAMAIDDEEVEVGGSVTISLEGVFQDSDDLTIKLANEDEAIADVTYRMSAHEIRAYGVAVGSTTVTVTATDAIGQMVDDEFIVTVIEATNAAPTTVGTIAGVTVEVGSDAYELDVGEYFLDPDGDTLWYATYTEGSAVNVTNFNENVTLEARSKGSATVHVFATDPDGLFAIQSFDVTASDGALKEVANAALAGYGRAMISSVSTTIASRIDSNREDRGFGFSRFNQAESVPSASSSAFGQEMTSSQHPESIQSSLFDWDSAAYGGAKSAKQVPQLNMNRFITLNNFSKNLNGKGGKGWSVWSSADAQNFEGSGYLGKTATSYLGVDVQKGDSLLFGVTVSRNRGTSDYTHGAATQTLDTSLTTVLPYVNYAPSSKTNVWAVLGRGAGAAETTVVNLDNESSDLAMNIGIVGGRHQFAQSDSMQFAVRGDAAHAGLSTGSGQGSADDLSANVNRLRVGLETAFTKAMFGSNVTPFSEVALRYDGGDGQTGSGVELAGGIRVKAKAMKLEARGHMTATHSATNFKESGMSIEATINPSSDGSGFSMSLTPSWGQSSYSQGSVWAQRGAYEATGASTLLSSQNGRMLSSKVGYGMFVASDRFMVTPFVDYRSESADTQTVLIGAELSQLVKSSKDMSMRFELGTGTGGFQGAGSKVGFTAELRF